jgi:hypothetical protein
MEKFFLRSRRVWAAVMPLIVVAAGLYGVEVEGLTKEFEKFGAAVALLVSSGMGIWSLFRPDGAKLKGKPGALVVLLAAWLTLGCATRLSVSDPFLTVVWGDAYTLDCTTGQAVVEDGAVVCPEGASVEVRGGHIGDSMASIFKAALELVAGLLPRGPTGP